jgi:hypothetical protein
MMERKIFVSKVCIIYLFFYLVFDKLHLRRRAKNYSLRDKNYAKREKKRVRKNGTNSS